MNYETEICPFTGKICMADKCRMYDENLLDCIFWVIFNELAGIGELLEKASKEK
jgi:hypothetical protein